MSQHNGIVHPLPGEAPESADYVIVRRWMTADDQRRDEFGPSRLLDALEALERELSDALGVESLPAISVDHMKARRLLEDYGRRNRWTP